MAIANMLSVAFYEIEFIINQQKLIRMEFSNMISVTFCETELYINYKNI